MKSPFYTVQAADGHDLTEHVTSFVFEDCIEEDDQLKLTLARADVALVDSKYLQKGQVLFFSFGYLGGPISKQRQATITGVTPSYRNFLTITITCGDAGLRLKKQQLATLYQGKTSSQIAEAIAKAHGLTAMVDATTHVWTSLPQAGRTDFDLLKSLASEETSGSYRFFIKQGVLHFNKVNYRKPSARTFRWETGGNGIVVGFEPSNDDKHKKGAAGTTIVAGVNPLTGEAYKAVVKDGHAPDDAKLGSYTTVYDGNGNELRREYDAVGRTTVPARDANHALDIAASDKKAAGNGDLTATLTTLGDPTQEVDEIITLEGVDATNRGNWYAKKLVHSLNPGSSYLNKWELTRNATNKPAAGDKNTDKNNAVGPDTAATKKPLRVIYDGNSNEIERK